MLADRPNVLIPAGALIRRSGRNSTVHVSSVDTNRLVILGGLGLVDELGGVHLYFGLMFRVTCELDQVDPVVPLVQCNVVVVRPFGEKEFGILNFHFTVKHTILDLLDRNPVDGFFGLLLGQLPGCKLDIVQVEVAAVYPAAVQNPRLFDAVHDVVHQAGAGAPVALPHGGYVSGWRVVDLRFDDGDRSCPIGSGHCAILGHHLRLGGVGEGIGIVRGVVVGRHLYIGQLVPVISVSCPAIALIRARGSGVGADIGQIGLMARIKLAHRGQLEAVCDVAVGK